VLGFRILSAADDSFRAEISRKLYRRAIRPDFSISSRVRRNQRISVRHESRTQSGRKYLTCAHITPN
jgi:hypothetical protein